MRILTFLFLLLLGPAIANAIEVGDVIVFDVHVKSSDSRESHDLFTIEVTDFEATDSLTKQKYKLKTFFTKVPSSVDEQWYSDLGLALTNMGMPDDHVTLAMQRCGKKPADGYREMIQTGIGKLEACTSKIPNQQGIPNTVSIAEGVPFGIVRRVYGPDAIGTENVFTLRSVSKAKISSSDFEGVCTGTFEKGSTREVRKLDLKWRFPFEAGVMERFVETTAIYDLSIFETVPSLETTLDYSSVMSTWERSKEATKLVLTRPYQGMHDKLIRLEIDQRTSAGTLFVPDDGYNPEKLFQLSCE